ncbi:MAG: signal transduction histidine kinase [Natronomonas sp.]|jgi:signal transduction histidine kinase|uniref:sensor histidine kinase n=1 Tax=Natronomonas sp. TaxID=2184060 RepID=UPI003989F2D3
MLTPADVAVVVLVVPALDVSVGTAVEHVRETHGGTPVAVATTDVPETRADAVVPVDAKAVERTLTELLDDERIARTQRRLRRLSAVGGGFVDSDGDGDGVARFCDSLVEQVGYDTAWLVRQEGSALVPTSAAGVPKSALHAFDIDADVPWSRAVRRGESVVESDGGYTVAVPFDGRCLVCTTDEAVGDAELAALGRLVTSFVSLDETYRPRYALLGEAIAHEVNNQLDLAMVHLDLIEESNEHLDHVASALNRIDDVVNEVNALIVQDLSTDPVELDAVAEAVWDGVSTNAATLDAHPGAVEADDRLLRLLLSNLFRNSVQHGGEDVTVDVAPLDSGGFYVEDDGKGFADAPAEELFEWGRSGEGSTGIGLALVSLAADRHGWDVEAADADGARFEFRP